MDVAVPQMDTHGLSSSSRTGTSRRNNGASSSSKGRDYVSSPVTLSIPTTTAASVMNIRWAPHRWMTDIQDALRDKRLNQVRMVGSHDAGTCHIDRHSEYGPDAPRLLQKRKEGNGWISALVRACATPISHGWAKTQSLTVLQQLLHGVRYLDIRVAPNPNDEDRFYITHTLMSAPLEDVVRDVSSFCRGDFGRNNDKDVVILDVQHVFGMDHTDVEACKRLFQVFSPLEPLFFPSYLGPQSTMSEIWRTPYRVLFCVGASLAYYPDYVHVRKSSVTSPWHNCNSAQRLMQKLLEELQQDLAVGSSSNSDGGSHYSTPPATGSPTIATSSNSNSSPSLGESEDGVSASPTSPTSRVRTLYITQAVMSPFTSDIIHGCVSMLRSTPQTIHDYASCINTIALRWFRDMNLCVASRRDVVADTIAKQRFIFERSRDTTREEDSDASSSSDYFTPPQGASDIPLGWHDIAWNDDVTNTHANVLLLDYVEDGTCEWYHTSAGGCDVRRPRDERDHKKSWSSVAGDAARLDLQWTLSTSKRDTNKSTFDAPCVHVNATQLCVYINLMLSNTAEGSSCRQST